MQTITQNTHVKRFLIILSAVLLITPVSIIHASDEDAKELKEQQQKLELLLDEIGNAREQRAEQKAHLEKLNKKMECNWALIQDYDACDKKYKEEAKKQLTCVKEAKEKARGCLSGIDE